MKIAYQYFPYKHINVKHLRSYIHTRGKNASREARNISHQYGGEVGAFKSKFSRPR